MEQVTSPSSISATILTDRIKTAEKRGRRDVAVEVLSMLPPSGLGLEAKAIEDIRRYVDTILNNDGDAVNRRELLNQT